MPALSSLGGVGTTVALAEMRVVPSLGASTRYDSNVFITPSGFTPEGRKSWDVATSISPGIELIDKDRVVETSLIGNLNGTVFVNNPELNFVSAQVTGTVKLDGLVGQFIPGLKVQVADSFLYSPESPSFVAAGTPLVTDNVFARGIQAVRADMLTNNTSVAASYPLSKSLSIQGNYTYSFFRVGKIDVPPSPDLPVVFFNTDYHRLLVGPTYKLSRGDTVGVDYTHVRSKFSDVTANVITSNLSVDETVTADGVEARYATGGLHWSLATSAGATIVARDGSSFFSGRVGFSVDSGPFTRFSLDVSRQLAPAFFGTAGVMISTNAGVTVDRRITEAISLSVSGNYAINEGTAGNDIRFESYGTRAMLNYNFAKSATASLSYSYIHFDVTSAVSESTVNRSLAMLTVTWRWK